MICFRLCPECRGYGMVGFWKCSDKSLALCCDECDAAWDGPDAFERGEGQSPSGPDFKIGEGCALRGPETGWATIEEIREAGWYSYIDQEGSR